MIINKKYLKMYDTEVEWCFKKIDLKTLVIK